MAERSESLKSLRFWAAALSAALFVISLAFWVYRTVQTADGLGAAFVTVLPMLGILAGGAGLAAAAFWSRQMHIRRAERAERAERQAVESEKGLIDLLESVPTAIALWDREDRLVHCNAKYRELFSGAADYLIAGMPFDTVLEVAVARNLMADVDGDPEGWLACRKALHAKPVATFERRLPGDQWYRVSDIRSELGGSVLLMTDITPLKRHERALEQSERRFRDFAEASSDLLWEMDADLCFTSVQDHVEDVTGMPPEDFLGKKRTDFRVGDDDPAKWEAHLEDLSARRAFRDFRYELLDRKGQRHELSVSGKPVFDETGTFAGYRGVTTDRTGVAEVEAAVEAMRLQMQEAIESISEGFALFDADDRLVMCNSNYRNLYPLAWDVMVPGAAFTDMARVAAERGQFVEAQGRIDEWLEARVKRHRNPSGFFEHHLADGRWLQTSERRTAAGGVVSVHMDITQLKLREQELSTAMRQAEAANRAKSDFMAVISHEIRTPLNGVLGMLGLLNDTGLREEQSKYVDLAQQSGVSLRKLLDEVLDFSRLEQDVFTPSRVEFRPVETVDTVVNAAAAQAGDKDVDIVSAIAADVPQRLFGDPERLQQILLNLTSNAVKFTESGKVGISVDVVRKRVGHALLRFAVEDTGIGIPPEARDSVFEHFTQVDPSASRQHGGAGLGLAICKRLVDLLGGTIGVVSDVGKGSTFWFELDFSTDRAAYAVPDFRRRSTPPGAPRGDGQHILLAEDSPTNQLVAKSILEDAGYKVDVVADGYEVLDRLAAAAYDLILMDVSMPTMDGIEATRQIRQRPDSNRIPIIAMTAHAFTEDRQRCLDAGMEDHLSKPFEKNDLLWAVHRNLGRSDGGRGGRVLDVEALSQLEADTDPATLPTLIDSFLTEARQRARKLEQAAKSGDLRAMEHEAHALKSSAQTFGASDLHSRAKAIEHACLSRRRAEAVALCESITDLADAAADALKERFGASA